MKSKIAYIGMGSNLSDPMSQILTAYTTMDQSNGIRCIELSPLYQSKAIGPEQPDFINAVAKIETHLSSIELLDLLQEIELQQKRVRKEHWGPRTIDLDILIFEILICNNDRLCIPHPQMTVRNFVLAPLLDIEPNLHMPTGESIKELLNQCGHLGLEKLPTKASSL